MITLLFFLALGFLLLKLYGLLYNLWHFPVLHLDGDVEVPKVSLLIPARNEAEVLPRTLPALLSQEANEVIILDDNSEDVTYEVAKTLIQKESKARVVKGKALPQGWTGKNWACWQLAQLARGEVLIFTDADVNWASGTLKSVLAECKKQEADIFSVFPKQLTNSLGERFIVPLIDDVLLSLLPFSLLSLPIPTAATANGQLLAFKKEAYLDLGGHKTLKGEVLEDVYLARRARRSGFKLGLAIGGDIITVRMYYGYKELLKGFSKNLLSAHGKKHFILVLSALWHLVVYTLPWFMLFAHPLWICLGLLGLLERFLVNLKTGRKAFWEVLLVPFTPIAALPLYLAALRPKATWKGRVYETS